MIDNLCWQAFRNMKYITNSNKNKMLRSDDAIVVTG
jgi:hypothetical protein